MSELEKRIEEDEAAQRELSLRLLSAEEEIVRLRSRLGRIELQNKATFERHARKAVEAEFTRLVKQERRKFKRRMEQVRRMEQLKK